MSWPSLFSVLPINTPGLLYFTPNPLKLSLHVITLKFAHQHITFASCNIMAISGSAVDDGGVKDRKFREKIASRALYHAFLLQSK